MTCVLGGSGVSTAEENWVVSDGRLRGCQFPKLSKLTLVWRSTTQPSLGNCMFSRTMMRRAFTYYHVGIWHVCWWLRGHYIHSAHCQSPQCVATESVSSA